MAQDVNYRESDGNTASPPPDNTRTVLIMAPCSGGTPNTVYSVGSPDALATLGNGPGVEAAKLILEVSGRPCLVMPMTTTAGTISTVTPAGVTPPTVTVTGSPTDNFDCKIEILVPGALATARFRYTLDGGNTWSDSLFTAASYPLSDGSGLTFGFAAGSYLTTHSYTFTASAPTFSASNLNTAFDAAGLSDYGFGIVYIVGEAGGADDATKASASAAIFGAAAAKQLALLNLKRPVRVIMEAPLVADAALLSAFASASGSGSRSPSVVAAWGRVRSAMPHGRGPQVNLARLIVPLIVTKPIGKDASAFQDDTYSGKLPAQLIAGTNVRDERKTPGLDVAKFTTVKSFLEVPGGIYIENVRLMSPFGSDYKYIQHGQVIDRALVVARAGLLPYLSRALDVKTAPVTEAGQLTEAQALAIEADITARLNDELVQPGHVQALTFQVDRTKDVKTTEEIAGRIRIASKAYPKSVDLVVGLAKSLPAAA